MTSLKPTGSSTADQARYAKLTAAAFEKAAGLARKAAATDPQWTALADSADKEAKAFAIVADATDGASTIDAQSVLNAAAQTRAQKPIFTAECQKAEGITPTPSSAS